MRFLASDQSFRMDSSLASPLASFSTAICLLRSAPCLASTYITSSRNGPLSQLHFLMPPFPPTNPNIALFRGLTKNESNISISFFVFEDNANIRLYAFSKDWISFPECLATKSWNFSTAVRWSTAVSRSWNLKLLASLSHASTVGVEMGDGLSVFMESASFLLSASRKRRFSSLLSCRIESNFVSLTPGIGEL